jgi:hypothetical protein
MMTRAHVLTPNNNTMASSMLESLRWCCGSMRARREIVIIQHGGDAPTKPFSGFDEHLPKQRAVLLLTETTGLGLRLRTITGHDAPLDIIEFALSMSHLRSSSEYCSHGRKECSNSFAISSNCSRVLSRSSSSDISGSISSTGELAARKGYHASSQTVMSAKRPISRKPVKRARLLCDYSAASGRWALESATASASFSCRLDRSGNLS